MSIALVTGASSGIGLEFCRQLAELSYDIVAVSNRPNDLQRCAAEIENRWGVKVTAYCLDLASADAAGKLLAFVDEKGLIPEIVINNAGIFDFKRVAHMPAARIDAYIDLHMRTMTHICRLFGGLMSGNGGGRILNMSSMSCWMPMPGIAMYSATKAYIRAFSRAFRIEMKDRDVSVTVACPGGIATDLFGLPERLQRLGTKVGALYTPQKFVRKALKRTLAGKAQYINGVMNRLAIPAVASLPEWARVLIRNKLLDRIDR